MREKHPEIVEEEVEEVSNGFKKKMIKKRFTPGHIQKMALWRTRSKFVDHLFMEWTRIEEEAERERRQAENGNAEVRVA
jgi:hypothetical protein